MYKIHDVGALLNFLTVAECGSINRAAGLLNVSQPALTRTIRLLEAAIGQPLFERTSKGVRLTAFGEQVRLHAQPIRTAVNSAERGIGQIQAAEPEQFHIAMTAMQPLPILANALLHIRKTENVSLRVSVWAPETALAMLERGECDMVLAASLLDERHRLLIQDGLVYSATAVYCGEHHRFAGVAGVGLGQLLEEKWTFGRAGSAAHVASFFHTHGLGPPVADIEIDDPGIRMAVVERSQHLSIFHDYNLLNVRPGSLVRVDCDWPQARNLSCAIRMIPHTPLSWKIVTTFRRLAAEAGLPVPASAKDP